MSLHLRPPKRFSTKLGVLALGLLGCEKPTTPAEPFQVEIRVTSDQAEPVAGAVVSQADAPLGESSGEGIFVATLQGEEGDTVRLQVACPTGYKGDEASLLVPLRRIKALDGVLRPLSYSVRCTPSKRTAVLLVRTREASGIPVLVNGKPSGQTSTEGIQHIAYYLEPGSRLDVQLDTSSQPDLLPSSPAREFKVADEDGLFIFDQPFERKKQKKKIRRRPKKEPVKHIPQRLE